MVVESPVILGVQAFIMSPTIPLDERVVLMTGTFSGIGAALTQLFLQRFLCISCFLSCRRNSLALTTGLCHGTSQLWVPRKMNGIERVDGFVAEVSSDFTAASCVNSQLIRSVKHILISKLCRHILGSWVFSFPLVGDNQAFQIALATLNNALKMQKASVNCSANIMESAAVNPNFLY